MCVGTCTETRGPPSFMRQSFSVGWSPVSRLGCLASKPQDPSVSTDQSWDYMCSTPVFLCECWGSNSDPHYCTLSTLSNALSPIALIQFRLSSNCLCSQARPWIPDPPVSTECCGYKHTPSASCILKLISTVSHMGFLQEFFFQSELHSSHSFFSTIITDFLCLLLVTTFW